MVMENEYNEEYDEYGDEVESASSPKWRTLSPKERKLLMKNVFSNPEWYDDTQGTPVFEGGVANPMFEEIAEKADAPTREVKRYYAAWLKSQGFTPADLKAQEQGESQVPQSTVATSSMFTSTPTPPMAPQLPSVQPPPADGGNEMWAMMQFLTQQQYMQMQQQQFQMQIAMDQRRLDQQKQSDDRR
ncbi:uncharacterized protein METZ01_LOCUS349953, partial [marine metagenome]